MSGQSFCWCAIARVYAMHLTRCYSLFNPSSWTVASGITVVMNGNHSILLFFDTIVSDITFFSSSRIHELSTSFFIDTNGFLLWLPNATAVYFWLSNSEWTKFDFQTEIRANYTICRAGLVFTISRFDRKKIVHDKLLFSSAVKLENQHQKSFTYQVDTLIAYHTAAVVFHLFICVPSKKW